jgi:hypothetical protein
MKKQIWLAAGITGMLLAYPVADTKAEVSVHISAGERVPAFAIERRPSFIELPGRGFSVSVGSPYDIISYGDVYYINQNGAWYRSSNYRGPWIYVRDHNLPSRIRRHHWDDIRRYRDIEYRRYEGRHNRDQRYNDHRGFDRNDRNDRFNDNRGFDRNDRNNDNRNDRYDGNRR